MAGGLVVSAPATITGAATFAKTMNRLELSPLHYKIPALTSPYRSRFRNYVASSTRLLCSFKCSSVAEKEQTVDLAKYKEYFSKRMAMAGLKPHHRIALGVSGGPDSMALCFLAAAWKTEGSDAVGKSDGFIDGLLAIIVDHGLRSESKEEAHIVSLRVNQMGIRCEIVQCSWSDGRPKQGHLLVAAREKRYQIFHNVCTQHQVGVLLIAHHADDQAELFILRLSRNSGVLGLAGMAFTSQVFSSDALLDGEGSKNEGVLLVRPLLHFSKEDMYTICRGGHQDWIEDPTNRSSLYARNRIRMSLANFSSCSFQDELQVLISTCRKTRAYVDRICRNLINQAVTIMDQQGYAIIDLEILNPSKVMDICLSKFVAWILQFISQRHRPVRGSTSKLLLDYLRAFPCKTSLTASGCYLCPAPGSKGTKMLVCCSANCPLPSNTELVSVHPSGGHKQCISSELDQIMADGKFYVDLFVPDASDVFFLEGTSESLLKEAKKLNIISDSTYENITILQRDEIRHFKIKNEDNDYKSANEIETVSASTREQLWPGQLYYFMNRFLMSWKLSESAHEKAYIALDLGGASGHHQFPSCSIDNGMVVEVRHMVESDWMCLAKLSKCRTLDDLQQQRVYVAYEMEQKAEERNLFLGYLRLSAERALRSLKAIPVAARRSLPVLVDCQGKLLSIPSISFNCCSCLMVTCEFKPRIPLGGGHISFA